MSQCDDIRQELEAYALDALDADTEAVVAQHLAECVDCSRLAREYAELVSHLPQALAETAPVEPPPILKTHLIAAINAGNDRRSTPRRAPGLRRYWPAALAALFLVSVILITQLSSALAREHQLRLEMSSQTELIFEVVDSEQSVRLFMRPVPGNTPQSDRPPYGKVFIRPDLPYVVAMAGRLPPPPVGQTYYLWLTDANGTRLAGEISIDDQGFGALVRERQGEQPAFESAMITLQPIGSTDHPGTPIVAWEN